MAGAHVGAQQHRAAAGHGRAQPRDPFRRLPIGDARIGQAAHGENRRIVLCRDIVVGRIGQDGAEILFALDRVAPFRPFRRRQRQRVVEHGVEHVDERHFGDDAGKQFAGAVGDRAHQHAAGAAAMADDAFCAGVFRIDQRPGAGGEIVKAVGLLLALAVEIPAPALVGAAADMGDGIDEAAVDQRQPVGVERGRHRHAVGAVAVKQQRRAAIARKILAMQDRHRHLGAVMRRRHDARGDVVGGIMAGRNLLALAQGPRPLRHVVVIDLRRRRHRRIGEPQIRGLEFIAAHGVERIGGLIEGDGVLLAGR